MGCGIAGFIDSDGRSGEWIKEVVASMASRLSHRGPDSEGVWVDDETGVALAHTRLAIIDLYTARRQPMQSHNS